MGGKLLLITNSKTHVSILGGKLGDLEWRWTA